MKTLLICILLLPVSAFSMGGDKAGPNGGFIKMPGAFHVELIDKGEEYQIYLLDISMKNPTTLNSSVSIRINKDNSMKIICQATKTYFLCPKPKKDLNELKELMVDSMRNKIRGGTAHYKIPLELEK